MHFFDFGPRLEFGIVITLVNDFCFSINTDWTRIVSCDTIEVTGK